MFIRETLARLWAIQNKNMATKHQHHEHSHQITSLDKVFIFGIILNLLFVAAETSVGILYNSLGLLSDAGHNLSDVFSLLLALLAFRLTKVRGNTRYTYGYKKSTILVSLLNAIILLIAVGAIVIESIHKLQHPSPVNGIAVSWTAGAGIIVNGLTAWMLMKRQKNDLNVRGAYLHMAADTLVSVGVVISGIIISLTGYSIIDPIISLAIAAIILISTWSLLSGSIRLSLDGVPENIDLKKIQQILSKNQYVEGCHHLHVWAISTTENALTAHLILSDILQLERVKQEVKQQLKEAGIVHATLEFELESGHCCDTGCNGQV